MRCRRRSGWFPGTRRMRTTTTQAAILRSETPRGIKSTWIFSGFQWVLVEVRWLSVGLCAYRAVELLGHAAKTTRECRAGLRQLHEGRALGAQHADGLSRGGGGVAVGSGEGVVVLALKGRELGEQAAGEVDEPKSAVCEGASTAGRRGRGQPQAAGQR